MGNEINELEKQVVRLETQVQMLSETFLGAILRLEKKLDDREQNYVTKDVLDSKLEIRDREIASLKVDKQTNKNNLPVWLGIIPSALAVIVAIIAIYK